MSLFTLPEKLTNRLLASMELADNTLLEIQRLAKNMNEGVTELRTEIAALKAARKAARE